MLLLHDLTDPRLSDILTSGGIAVIRTDTIYGVVAVASSEESVELIYTVKSRQPHKQLIVLINSVDDVSDDSSQEVLDILAPLWPGRNSVILPSTQAAAWLLRGGDSLAYRVPDDDTLRALLRKTGPLVAPSANPESLPPAITIDEAIAYFGDDVDVYVDGGTVTDTNPSRLYQLEGDTLKQLR
ncbi:MAG: L-threonylcarbamoyladenylate synthase [Candidatus Saccharimonadales bacterium]